jgi:O-antigen/teichoic acid export membrane protein
VEPDSFQDEKLRSNLARKVVRAGTAAAGLALTTQVLAFASFIVLAHFAPPATFGEYAAASVLLGVSGLFTEAGMHAAVIQRRKDVQAAASTAFLANLVGGLGLAAIAAAAAPLIAVFFHSQTTGFAAAALAGTIPVNAAAIVPAAIIRRRVSVRLTLLDPVNVLVYGAVAVMLLSAGLGVWALVLATYAAAFLRTTAIWSLSGWRPTFSLASWAMWRSLARYGRPVVISLFLREIGFGGITAFVGRAFGTTVLGQFRYAQRLVVQANSSITLSGAYVLLPAFSRIADDEARFRTAVLRALRILTLLVFPVSLAFIPLGRPIAATLLGDEWSGAGPILMALGGVGIALSLSSVSAEAFKASGRTDLLPRLHGLTATAPLAFMFLLLPAGPVGMGLAVSLGLSVEALYAVRALGRVAQIRLATIFRQLLPPLLSSLVMVALVFLLERYVVHAESAQGLKGVVLLVLELVVGAVTYLGALVLISMHSVIELRQAAGYVIGRQRSPNPAGG